MDEHLRDLAAVRLVRHRRRDHLHRADELPVRERREQQPAAGIDLGREALERGAGVGMRERIHVPDRRAAGDAVVQHGRERVEPLAEAGAEETADLDR